MFMFNQETSKPEASQKENGDMGWACCEELVELDDVQLATVVGGNHCGCGWSGPGIVVPTAKQRQQYYPYLEPGYMTALKKFIQEQLVPPGSVPRPSGGG